MVPVDPGLECRMGALPLSGLADIAVREVLADPGSDFRIEVA
jgi:hypothetical protein